MDEVRTSKLVLVDHQDIPRITMGVSLEGVAELSFTDTQGNERLRLAVSESKHGNDSVICQHTDRCVLSHGDHA